MSRGGAESDRGRQAGVGIADDVAAEWEVYIIQSLVVPYQAIYVFVTMPATRNARVCCKEVSYCMQVRLADGIHRVRLDHGTTSGKRVITVDGKEVNFV